MLEENRAWVWSHPFNPGWAGRLQAELCRLERETGTSNDVCLAYVDSKATLPGVRWGLMNNPTSLCLSHIIQKLSIIIVSTACCCSEDCMAS